MFKSALICAAALLVSVSCSGATDAKTPSETPASSFAAQLPALSGDDVWTMNADKSKLEFTADYNGEFTAEFESFSVAIKLDPAAPQTGEIHAIVDLSSLRAGNSDVRANLPTPAWFDTKAHPVATFVSKDISGGSDTGFRAKGDITLKGITKPSTLTFTLSETGNSAIADGTFTLDRTDFNVGTGSDFTDESWVKFPVKINVHIEATRR